ncbi:hypothetical protein J421_4498 [Gemmatirosa kalamazoonensis]|uniref:Uncharacterized protein n=1 Tax=Gemmatirosa kalamazoonensis TaxID=861299 RepID=W0RNV6_9BACT|nr:hypothetical protein J421_4498 [Gemmatirosa kalamazoonensis]
MFGSGPRGIGTGACSAHSTLGEGGGAPLGPRYAPPIAPSIGPPSQLPDGDFVLATLSSTVSVTPFHVRVTSSAPCHAVANG